MRAFIYLLLQLLFLNSAIAQVTLEHAYNGNPVSTQMDYVKLTLNGEKYLLKHYNVVSFYNLDHSLWKTVTISIPTGGSYYWIDFVTDSLVDDDSSLEFICQYTNGSGLGSTEIVDEDGTVYLDRQDFNINKLIKTSLGARLLLSNPTTYAQEVYSFVGSFNEISSSSNFSSNPPYPNPASSRISLPYDFPGDFEVAELTVYYVNGTVAHRATIDHSFNNYLLDIHAFPAGVYFYQISSGNWRSAAVKFCKQ